MGRPAWESRQQKEAQAPHGGGCGGRKAMRPKTTVGYALLNGGGITKNDPEVAEGKAGLSTPSAASSASSHREEIASQ